MASPALLIFLIVLLKEVLDGLLQWYLVTDTSAQQQALKTQARALRQEIPQLNTPQTFVQCAKAERRLVAIERELDRLTTAEAEAKAHPALYVPRALRLLLAAFIIYAVWWRRTGLLDGVELVAIDWPWMSRLLSQPGIRAAAVWAMLCQRSARLAVQGARGALELAGRA